MTKDVSTEVILDREWALAVMDLDRSSLEAEARETGKQTAFHLGPGSSSEFRRFGDSELLEEVTRSHTGLRALPCIPYEDRPGNARRAFERLIQLYETKSELDPHPNHSHHLAEWQNKVAIRPAASIPGNP